VQSARVTDVEHARLKGVVERARSVLLARDIPSGPFHGTTKGETIRAGARVSSAVISYGLADLDGVACIFKRRVD
jgi:hypothetical protein